MASRRTDFDGALGLVVEGGLQVDQQLIVDVVPFGEVLFRLELDGAFLDTFDRNSCDAAFPVFSELEVHVQNFVVLESVEESQFQVHVDAVLREAEQARPLKFDQEIALFVRSGFFFLPVTRLFAFETALTGLFAPTKAKKKKLPKE